MMFVSYFILEILFDRKILYLPGRLSMLYFLFQAMRVVLVLHHLLKRIFSSLDIAYDSEAK